VTIAEPLLDVLNHHADVEWAVPTGSLRRGQDTVGDIEIVAASAQPARAIDELLHLPEVVRSVHRSDRRVHLLFDRAQVSVRFPQPEQAAAALLHTTGSVAHVASLAARARQSGWLLSTEGLLASNGDRHPAPTEEHIYAVLGLQYVPPEIRNGDGEIDAARLGTLPALITRRDIRGDLHMHTTWSDGRDSAEAMVDACRALGYEYLAITDHSPRSAASRNLSIEDVERQADELEQLREQFRDIVILHGCEVDIMPDGQLDFPDRVLERFDIVLASLHDRSGQSPEQLLKRYLTAMRHPLVTFITHPTNRLVPHRRGYELDYDRLFEAAVETGTLVEIDGAPGHLDLDGALARRAVAAGATMTVNSDSHRADVLGRQMELGVMTARRGWVERSHVINTRPVDAVRALVARKRGHT
jgi:DNA polymerase (family 10)